MDPATVFLVYIVGVLCLWLLGTIVHPALVAVSRVGIRLPMGRPFAALAISLVLLTGVVRMGSAQGSVGPASHRMVQMVDEPASETVASTASIGIYPMLTKALPTYTVEAGDSLWGIARSILEDRGTVSGADISDLWRSIYEANRDLIGSDPNLIHPGQVLQLPGR